MSEKHWAHTCTARPLNEQTITLSTAHCPQCGKPRPTTPSSHDAGEAAGKLWSFLHDSLHEAHKKLNATGGGEVYYAALDSIAAKLEKDVHSRFIATLTAEVSRLTEELDEASARLHEVATLCATVEQERDRLTAELAEAQRQRLPEGYITIPCEAWDAQMKIEGELERSRKECEGLREAAGVMLPLARRALWIAYVWNDHNFDAAFQYAVETARKYDINSFDEANEAIDKWEAALSASGREVNDAPSE